MADFAIYWQRYRDESGDGEPVTGWLTSREWFVNRLHTGDRIWLFIGGDAFGDTVAPHRCYLAQLLVVRGWRNNPDYEPDVQGSSRYRIVGVEERCVLVDPPILVDEIFRRDVNDQRHIGLLRQTPFELDGGETTMLLPLLQNQRPEVYAVAMQT